MKIRWQGLLLDNTNVCVCSVHGLSRGVPPERNIKGQQMAPALHQPPKWEARLHLPTGPWPTPVAQYSVRAARQMHSIVVCSKLKVVCFPQMTLYDDYFY